MLSLRRGQVPSARESIEVVADGFFSSHGSGALAGAFLGLHVRSACGGGMHDVALKPVHTIAIAMAQSDFPKETT